MRLAKPTLSLSLLVPCALLAFAARGREGGAPAPAAYDAAFTARTMRVDLAHTGGPAGEVLAVDRVVDDGPWSGSTTRLIDDTNLGTYLFAVVDPETNRPLFTRGYSSMYAEWETTPEAKRGARTLQESLRLPWPKRPVQIKVSRRDRENLFKEIASFRVDPASLDANRAALSPAGRVWTVFENGPATQKVDLLVLGDGYTEAQLPKFHEDVKRLIGILFETEPFKSRKGDFNVRALDLPVKETGILRPQAGIFRRTPLGTQYSVFGSERYVLTYDDRALRDIASAAPYDFLEILVNDAQYGGGGIYNYQATASVDTGFATYVFVHEFGHHFAGLADEYYTSAVAYETTGGEEHVEPWEPNVTALHDPKNLKWKELVEASTPLPTPWDKAVFETDSRKVQAERKKLIDSGAAPSASTRSSAASRGTRRSSSAR
jgi:IgA peptidase M64/peptidase M64-like protein